MTTRLAAACACGSFSLHIDLPDAQIPVDCAICLCRSCRQSSGSGGMSVVPVLPSQAIELSRSNLSFIRLSDGITRYFCSTCGAHVMIMPDLKSGFSKTFLVSTGILDRTDDIINWVGCKGVGETLDGGMSIWLREIIDVDGSCSSLNRWVGTDSPDGELVPKESLTLPLKLQPTLGEDKLGAQCACGGVRFYVTRPNDMSKRAESPFPDLIFPYHTHSSTNSKNEKWWLRGQDKYLAGLCTCTTCRSSSGSEVQPWAFIPSCNIFQEDGRPLDYGMGTLKRYTSSQGVSREFCSVCGATVFWHCTERPDLIDVSVGLLDASRHGARAESWLEWWKERVSFEELSVSRRLVQSLEGGMRRESHGGRGGEGEIKVNA